jgi:bifunctional UDP-N-acetylglucosamine pyrophosphorylase/glucosamine-1-phosphate N-acetyltransferase
VIQTRFDLNGDALAQRPGSADKIKELLQKGVDISNPLTLDVGQEVDTARISGRGVRIYPGCRIHGKKTVISEGAQLGYEAPVTIENCQVGPFVELKGGFFKESAFLEEARLGLGAHVREGCLLEEQVNGAHCVALKQTILFPFVTLGSLINFCDCLMAGGTGRDDHSEVGSGYIHFNFTPDGDKTTPSLIGDVPRGVLLKQPRIFLGGQGGMVGPVRLGYGSVVAAGTVLRNDSLEDNKLIVGKSYKELVTTYTPYLYAGLSRILENNIIYLANLVALEQWYLHVRQGFFNRQDFGSFMYEGALDKLSLAKTERVRRLKTMADRISLSLEKRRHKEEAAAKKSAFARGISQATEIFFSEVESPALTECRDRFVSTFQDHWKTHDGSYLEVIQALPGAAGHEAARWLQQIVDELCARVSGMMPSLKLFEK